MTKKWCNRFPPNVWVLGENRMTEVRSKKSITRYRERSEREKCKVVWCAKGLDPKETRITGATSLYEVVPVLKAAGEAYLCPLRQSTKNKAPEKPRNAK